MDINQRTFTQHEVATLLDEVWQQLVAYPFPQVCKHLVASNLLGTMEDMGMAVPDEIATAVCRADDDIALSWTRPKSPPIWQPSDTAPEGKAVLLRIASRSWYATGRLVRYCADDDTDRGPATSWQILHYNGEILFSGFYGSPDMEWSLIPGVDAR